MRRNKYRAEPVVIDGIRFDSRREGNRYVELKLLRKAGKIAMLELQPKYPLEVEGRPVLMKSERYPGGRRVSYFADFRYWDADRRATVVEDCKGFDTPTSRLKRAIVEAQYQIEIVLL